MHSSPRQHRPYGRQHLLLVLLLGVVLGLGQLLLATHDHADGLAQHEDCVLCHQHGSGFDHIPPTAQLPDFGQLGQHTPFQAGTAPFILPPKPRARAPPTSA